MKRHELRKLHKALVEAEDGPARVHVTLQYQPTLPVGSRQDRKQFLRQQFEEIGKAILADEGSVDLDSLSVSAQMVEATITADAYEQLVHKLAQRQVQVNPLYSRQIVEF